MATTTKDIGDKTRLIVTFTNASDTATDPTGITFAIVEPDGTETDYTYGVDAELVKSGTGVYYVDWTPDQAGRHRYRFAGTGTVQQAAVGDLYARRDETA